MMRMEPAFTISSPGAFGSGELNMYIIFVFHSIFLFSTKTVESSAFCNFSNSISMTTRS